MLYLTYFYITISSKVLRSQTRARVNIFFLVLYSACPFKISWTDRVRNEEVLHRVKEERKILHTVKRRKDNWIGHILRRKWLLKQVTNGKIEGRIEVTGRRGIRRKQLLDDLKEEKRIL
jgi:hypothetical protein